jgi:hypothetical protein
MFLKIEKAANIREAGGLTRSIRSDVRKALQYSLLSIFGEQTKYKREVSPNKGETGTAGRKLQRCELQESKGSVHYLTVVCVRSALRENRMH